MSERFCERRHNCLLFRYKGSSTAKNLSLFLFVDVGIADSCEKGWAAASQLPPNSFKQQTHGLLGSTQRRSSCGCQIEIRCLRATFFDQACRVRKITHVGEAESEERRNVRSKASGSSDRRWVQEKTGFCKKAPALKKKSCSPKKERRKRKKANQAKEERAEKKKLIRSMQKSARRVVAALSNGGAQSCERDSYDGEGHVAFSNGWWCFEVPLSCDSTWGKSRLNYSVDAFLV